MTVCARFLRDRRRSATWWVAGVVALVLFTVAFWPTIRGQASFDEVVQQLPVAMRTMFGIDEAVSIGSAPGYLHGRVFATILPLLLIINAIGLGTAAVAGSEGDGTLELILAHPVSRLRFFAERGLAAMSLLALTAIVAGGALVLLGAPVGLLDGVDRTGLAAALASAFALALLFGAIAFAVGAATGNRSVAISTAAGLAVATYLAQGLLTAANAPTPVLDLSPWHWYLEHNMLLEGPTISAIAAPVIISTIAIAVAVPRLSSRDLS